MNYYDLVSYELIDNRSLIGENLVLREARLLKGWWNGNTKWYHYLELNVWADRGRSRRLFNVRRQA